jgi:hypothetical protein
MEQLWLNIKQRYLSNMAFKDYEEIVDKYCDAWNDILKKDNFVKKLCSREWIELVLCAIVIFYCLLLVVKIPSNCQPTLII